MRILSGTSNPLLAHEICEILEMRPIDAAIKRFSDGEIFVSLNESVRGEEVFVIQSISSPVNDHLMELFMMTDALKRNSAAKVTAVIPYFGYARQDRKIDARTSISSKLVANLLTVSGISRILTVDLHSDQIQGFFDIPVDNIKVSNLFIQDILKYDFQNPVIVSPDIGSINRARHLAEKMNLDLVILDKRRMSNGTSFVTNIMGDVAGKTCIIIDDMVDSGGTLIGATDILLEKGAKAVHAYVTHGILSKEALGKLENSALNSMIITDSIAQQAHSHKLQLLPLAPLLSGVIQNIHLEKSIEGLFSNEI